jgi:ABC-type glutathione transport system ATPase component
MQTIPSPAGAPPRDRADAALLEVDNLTMEYEVDGGNVGGVNVSFTLQAGESLGLVGESGCGKTSVAMCCSASRRTTPVPGG